MSDIYILGIESSCDDTSAAVLRNGVLLSNVTASQEVHRAYGGVVPELASRAHQQNIVPVVDQALHRAGHRGQGMLIVPGMVFTIEPMINMGTYEVFIDADDPYEWEVITGDELPSAQWEHTFVMTENGVEILTY